MTTAPRPATLRPAPRALWVLCAAVMLGACGGPPEPEAVQTCLREEGLSVARQSGVSTPVETKINFTTSGVPDPASSGSVIFYESEEEATRNLRAAERSGETLRQRDAVLYSPFRAGGTPDESEALVEGCVVKGEAGAPAEGDDDSDKKKKKKRKKR